MKMYHELTGKVALKQNFFGRIILWVEEIETTVFEADIDAPEENVNERAYYRKADKNDIIRLGDLLADSVIESIEKEAKS